jgi:hypothetical protein
MGGQLVNFFVERLVQVFVGPCVRMIAVPCDLGRSLFHTPPLNCGNLDPSRRAAGHSMEPWSQRVFYPKCAASAHQNEKCRLKRVFGVVVVADNPQASTQHHRTVPLDQGRKGDLCRVPAPARKLFEELTIRQSGDNAHVEQRVDVARNGVTPSIWHRSGPLRSAAVFLLIKASSLAKGSSIF